MFEENPKSTGTCPCFVHTSNFKSTFSTYLTRKKIIMGSERQHFNLFRNKTLELKLALLATPVYLKKWILVLNQFYQIGIDIKNEKSFFLVHIGC